MSRDKKNTDYIIRRNTILDDILHVYFALLMILKCISHSVHQQVHRQAAVYQSLDNGNGFARFQVLTEVFLKIHVYWNVMPYQLANIYQLF